MKKKIAVIAFLISSLLLCVDVPAQVEDSIKQVKLERGVELEKIGEGEYIAHYYRFGRKRRYYDSLQLINPIDTVFQMRRVYLKYANKVYYVDTNVCFLRLSYSNGKYKITKYDAKKNKIFEGKSQKLFPIKWIDTLIHYNKNSTIKKMEMFSADKLERTHYYSIYGGKLDTVYMKSDVSIGEINVYGENITNFQQYAFKNIEYPQTARDNDIMGYVNIMFIVSKEGRVVYTEPLSEVPILAEYISEFLLSLPMVTKPNINNEAVNCIYVFSMKFDLAP